MATAIPVYGIMLLILAAVIFCVYKLMKRIYRRFGKIIFGAVVVFCFVIMPLALFLVYRYALDADIVGPSAKIENVRYSEAFDNGQKGLMVHYDITCYHLKGRNIINSIEIIGKNEDGVFTYLTPISKTSVYRSRKDRTGISRTEYCNSNYKKWKDYTFFIPYEELKHAKGENKYKFNLWIDYQKTKDPTSSYEHIYSHDKNWDKYSFHATFDKASAGMTPVKKKATEKKASAQKTSTATTDTTKTTSSEEEDDWDEWEDDWDAWNDDWADDWALWWWFAGIE
ncbi:MAG: hypothetical protein IJ776_04815 [Paludibacteraceae bacterium]|nr:hypothetical protein [Paludibacteraceae bacterium]